MVTRTRVFGLSVIVGCIALVVPWKADASPCARTSPLSSEPDLPEIVCSTDKDGDFKWFNFCFDVTVECTWDGGSLTIFIDDAWCLIGGYTDTIGGSS